MAISELDRAEHGFELESHELLLEAGPGATVLAGDFLGEERAALVVLDADEDERPRLRTFALEEGRWALVATSALGPRVRFVDVLRQGGSGRLLAVEPTRWCAIDLVTGAERTLVHVESDFSDLTLGGVPHLDVTRDVNGDGRDDLVVPDHDGFWIAVQREDGSLSDPWKVGPPFDFLRLQGTEGYRHDPWPQSRIFELDHDGDGRSDLASWKEDHFEIHLQGESGLFGPVPSVFTTEIAFDSDDPAYLAAPRGVRRRRFDHMPDGLMSGRILHSLTDMNRDGVADVVVFSLNVEGMWSAHCAFEVHFGRRAPDGGVSFSHEPDTALVSDGLPFDIRHRDLDGDGQADLMVNTIEVGPFKTIALLADGLLTGATTHDLHFYRVTDGAFPSSPQASRESRRYTRPVSGQRAVHPSVLLGDLNGDGLTDLLVQDGEDELRVYLGERGQGLFEKRAHRLELSMPREEFAWMADVDGNGTQDLVLHERLPGRSERVITLIAR